MLTLCFSRRDNRHWNLLYSHDVFFSCSFSFPIIFFSFSFVLVFIFSF